MNNRIKLSPDSSTRPVNSIGLTSREVCTSVTIPTNPNLWDRISHPVTYGVKDDHSYSLPQCGHLNLNNPF